jgi:hypothetical protein
MFLFSSPTCERYDSVTGGFGRLSTKAFSPPCWGRPGIFSPAPALFLFLGRLPPVFDVRRRGSAWRYGPLLGCNCERVRSASGGARLLTNKILSANYARFTQVGRPLLRVRRNRKRHLPLSPCVW